jgi:cytochrome c553
MSHTRITSTIILAGILFVATAAFASDSKEDIRERMGAGNPVAGKVKSVMCQVCHGEKGMSPDSSYPNLAGQYAAYIQKQMNNFKSGLRNDPVMSDIAAAVSSDQDLLDMAAYFASRKKMKGDNSETNDAGQAQFLSEGNGCVNCHGSQGKGLAPGNPLAPVIGGQNKDYLVKQLKAFRSGTRTNEPSGLMEIIASSMSDAEIEEVASYISGL